MTAKLLHRPLRHQSKKLHHDLKRKNKSHAKCHASFLSCLPGTTIKCLSKRKQIYRTVCRSPRSIWYKSECQCFNNSVHLAHALVYLVLLCIYCATVAVLVDHVHAATRSTRCVWSPEIRRCVSTTKDSRAEVDEYGASIEETVVTVRQQVLVCSTSTVSFPSANGPPSHDIRIPFLLHMIYPVFDVLQIMYL